MFKMSPKSDSQSNLKLKSSLNHQKPLIQSETEIYNYLADAKELLKEHSQKNR